MILSEFLLARIAEDEADIGDLANAYPWEPHYGGRRMEWTHDGFMANPRYLLAECEAKRRIIEFAFANAAVIDGEWACCHSGDEIRRGECRGNGRDAAEDALTLLAQPYAGHPDFQASWSLTVTSEQPQGAADPA